MSGDPLTIIMISEIEHLKFDCDALAVTVQQLREALEYFVEMPQNKFIWKGSEESNTGVRRVIDEFMPVAQEALSLSLPRLLPENSMKKKLLPGNAKQSTTVELPALIALKGLGQSWFKISHFNDILSIVLIWHEMCTWCEVTNDIKELLAEIGMRKIVNGDYAFKEEEIRRLRELVPMMVEAIAKSPNNKVDAAIQKILASKN